MTDLAAVVAGIAAVNKALAADGTSLTDLAGAVEKGLSAFAAKPPAAPPSPGAAALGVAEDVLSAAIPELAPFIAIVGMITALPGYRPARLDDPVMLARSDDPYEQTDGDHGE